MLSCGGYDKCERRGRDVEEREDWKDGEKIYNQTSGIRYVFVE